MPISIPLWLVALGSGFLFYQAALAQQIYRCQSPDGRISFQQTACPAQSVSSPLATPAGPDSTSPAATDYSVISQAERMRVEREARERRHAQARHQQAARLQAQGAPPAHDPVKCARHRAEAAKWQQRLKSGYRTREERVYRENKLAYHQALIARHCAD